MQKIKDIFLFTVFLFCFLLIKKHYPVFSDEGQITANVIRVLRGQVIYRDFFTFLPPGSIYFIALLAKIFGVSRELIYITTSLTFSIICFSTYYIMRTKSPSMLLSISPLVLSIAPVMTSWYELSYHWLSTATGLLAFIFMWKFIDKEKYHSLLIAGIFYGVTVLFLHTKGTLLLLAGIVTMTTKNYLNKYKTERILREFLILVSGFFIPVLPFILYLILTHAISNMIYDTVIWVANVYYPFNKYPYYFYYGFYKLNFVFSNYPLYRALYYSVIFFLAGLIPIIALVVLMIKLFLIKERKELIINLHFFLTSFMFFVSSLYRSDVPHLFMNIPLLLVAFFDGTYFIIKKIFPGIVKPLMIVFACLTTLYSLSIYSSYLLKRAYKIFTPGGTIYQINPVWATHWQEIFEYLTDYNLKDGDLFTYPHSESLYYILNLNPPTSYDCILPGRNSKVQLIDVINQLNYTKPKFVIMDNLIKNIINDKWDASYPMADINELINDPISQYIKENYVIVKSFPFLTVLKLNNQ